MNGAGLEHLKQRRGQDDGEYPRRMYMYAVAAEVFRMTANVESVARTSCSSCTGMAPAAVFRLLPSLSDDDIRITNVKIINAVGLHGFATCSYRWILPAEQTLACVKPRTGIGASSLTDTLRAAMTEDRVQTRPETTVSLPLSEGLDGLAM